MDILIFVTLGTQDKSFSRLLEAVQKQIDNGILKNEDIVVQAGYTKFESDDMKIFDMVSMEEFTNYIDKCDILITHGGVGSIIDGLKHNKKIIAAARLEKFKEHENDHQLQIVETFSDEGYILKLDNFDKLDLVLKEIKGFNPKKYASNNDIFCQKLKKYIDSN